MNNPTTKGTPMNKLVVLAILTSLSMSAIAAPKAITPGPDQKENVSIIANGLNTIYACQSVASLIITSGDTAPFVEAHGCSVVSTSAVAYEAWPNFPVSVHVDFKKAGMPIDTTCDFRANSYATALPGSTPVNGVILDCRTP